MLKSTRGSLFTLAMSCLAPCLMAGLGLAGTAQAANAPLIPAEFRYSSDYILCVVAHKMHTTLRSDIPVPKIFVGSQTPLTQFQDAVEPQWGFRPDGFLNAYIWRLNEVYLLDDSEYYQKTDRAIDDSLAHELTHYIQVKYRNADLSNDELAEMEAVDVQTWFRENFIRKTPPSDVPCSLETTSSDVVSVTKQN